MQKLNALDLEKYVESRWLPNKGNVNKILDDENLSWQSAESEFGGERYFGVACCYGFYHDPSTYGARGRIRNWFFIKER